MKVTFTKFNRNLIVACTLVVGIFVLVQSIGIKLFSTQVIPDWVDLLVSAPLLLLIVLLILKVANRISWSENLTSAFIVVAFFKLFLIIELNAFGHIYRSEKMVIVTLADIGVRASDELAHLIKFMDKCADSKDECTGDSEFEFTGYGSLMAMAYVARNLGNIGECEETRTKAKQSAISEAAKIEEGLAVRRSSAHYHLSPLYHINWHFFDSRFEGFAQSNLQRIELLDCNDLSNDKTKESTRLESAVDKSPTLYFGSGIRLQVAHNSEARIFGNDECPESGALLFGSITQSGAGCIKITGKKSVDVRLVFQDGSELSESWRVNAEHGRFGTGVQLVRPNGWVVREPGT